MISREQGDPGFALGWRARAYRDELSDIFGMYPSAPQWVCCMCGQGSGSGGSNDDRNGHEGEENAPAESGEAENSSVRDADARKMSLIDAVRGLEESEQWTIARLLDRIMGRKRR